jgi:type II secretory pathway pseudopilin PulG
MNQAVRRMNSRQSGFTLVELTLSMAFIALLLLGIAMLTLQISSIYNKGLTLRAVNESGQLIASDIQRTLNMATPTEVLSAGDATGGRLCANSSVYAWNYASQLTTGFNRFDTPGREVRMVRFTGDDTYCKPQPPSGQYRQLPSTADTMTELLKAGDNTLAIHAFEIGEDAGGSIGNAVNGDDTQRIYDVTFRLGSNDTAIIASNGCESPTSRADDEYCAVNDFSFTARAGNKGVSDE